jgi:hypothetical protein
VRNLVISTIENLLLEFPCETQGIFIGTLEQMSNRELLELYGEIMIEINVEINDEE